MDVGYPAILSLDVLAIAILPYRAGGLPAFQFGGCVVNVRLLAGLAAAGHRVRAIHEAPPDTRPRAGVEVPGVEVDWFRIDYMSGRVIPDEASVARRRAQLTAGLEHALRGGVPDVVLLGREAQGWYAPQALGAAGAPVVALAQGVPTAGLDGGMYPPEAEREFVARLGSVDEVVAVAGHLEASLRARGLDRVRTIANVIDDRFRPVPRDPAFLRRVDVDPGAPVVAHVCGLLPGKRPADLVASAARVAARLPSVRYLVAGADEEPSAAREAARRLGIDHVFRWLGEVDREDMPSLLNAADLMIHTSEREGAPLILLEAAACGLPVVATDIPAMREHPGALLYPVGDVEALADATLALLVDPSRRAALASAATAPHTGLAEWVARHEAVLAEVGAGVA